VNLVDRDIICLSTHYWDDRWFRKQEFMSRFARRNRVLYVEPSFSMVRTWVTTQGPALTTVTGTIRLFASKTWVMPSFSPRTPWTMRPVLAAEDMPELIVVRLTA